MPLGSWELTNIEDEMSTFDSIFGWKIVSSWIWAHQSYTFFWNQLSQTKYEWNIWKKHQYRFCETERIFTESIWALKAIFFVLKIKLPQPTLTHIAEVLNKKTFSLKFIWNIQSFQPKTSLPTMAFATNAWVTN